MNSHHLPRTLRLVDALRFPIASPAARRDVVIGGIVLLVLLPIGWILNLGNRLNIVGRLYRGERPLFTDFQPWPDTLQRGLISFAAIVSYLSPAAACFYLADQANAHNLNVSARMLHVACIVCFGLGVFILPGCMTVFACEGDARVLLNPMRAWQRAVAQRQVYLRAWAIALLAISLSALGLLVLGIGFAFTSVWAWTVVGYAFTVAMYAPQLQR